MHPRLRSVAAIAAPSRNASRTLGALALTAGLLVAFQVVAPAPASAALPGAVGRSAQSPFDSERAKTIEATCPPGKRVTGGSGRVTGITSHVVLTRMQPRHTNNPDVPDSYVVTAIEDETAPEGRWAVTAYALCSDPLPGQTIVISRSPTDSGNSEREIADCPAGRRALGSGVRINGGSGQVHVTEMTMGAFANGRTSSFVTARENQDGFGGDWSLDAFAVCATIAPERQVYLSSFAPEPGSADRKVADVTCPAGMTITGGGAEIGASTGSVVMERILPEFLVGGIPGDEYTAVAREEIPSDDFWSLRVVASCVD
jgi:hypothetical protein